VIMWPLVRRIGERRRNGALAEPPFLRGRFMYRVAGSAERVVPSATCFNWESAPSVVMDFDSSVVDGLVDMRLG
jgi:hypothetical protein